MDAQTVSRYYLDGIREGREIHRREGKENAAAHIANLRETIKGFSAASPVGQMLRGELDFWRSQLHD